MGCNSSTLNDGVNTHEGTNYKKTAQDITKKVNNVINRIDAQLAYDDQVQAQLESNTSDVTKAAENVATTAANCTTDTVTNATNAAAATAIDAINSTANAVTEAVNN